MSLRNDMSKHRLFVQRLVGTEAASITTFLDNLQFHAKKELANGTSGKLLQTRLRDTMKDLHKVAIDNMVDVAAYEAKFSAGLWSKYFDADILSVEKDNLRKSLITDNIAVNNVKLKGTSVLSVDNGATRKSLSTAYKQFGMRKADEITQVIKDAAVNDLTRIETLAKIEEKIAGLHTAQARSLASVAINYSTNIAKSQVIEENRDIIAQEQWVRDTEADSCDECESLDGTVEGAGSFESPPIHWGCRCEVIPYVE